MKNLIFLLLLTSPIFSQAQDLVFLKSGEQYGGKIISINDDRVIINNNGNLSTFQSLDVATVRYGEGNSLVSNFSKTDSIVGRMIPSFTAISRYSHSLELTTSASIYEGFYDVRLEMVDLQRLNSNVSYGMAVGLGLALDPTNYTNNGNYKVDEKFDNALAFSIAPAIRLNSHYVFGFLSMYFQAQTGPSLISDYYGEEKQQEQEIDKRLRLGWHFSPSLGLDLKFNNFHLMPTFGGLLLNYREKNINNEKISAQEFRAVIGLRISFDYNRPSNKALYNEWID